MDASADVTGFYWNGFYGQNRFQKPSSFCEYVAGTRYLRQKSMDIGCGDGRDSLALARLGCTVLGVDQSEVAIQNNAAEAAKAGLASLHFRQGDLGDVYAMSELIALLRSEAPDSPILFYCRFVLHAISEATQERLMSTIAGRMQAGDVFAAEFRTSADEFKHHVHGGHYRRYQDGRKFAKSLENRFKLKVAVYQEGNGFSPYKDEDPELCRVIAAR